MHLIPTRCSRQGRQAVVTDVTIDPLTEIARSGLIAGNPRALLTNDVRALSDNLKNCSVYPNPSKGRFTITGLKDVNYVLQVTDITGKLLKQTSLKAVNGELSVDLELQDGVYFIRLQDAGNHSAYLKLLIE